MKKSYILIILALSMTFLSGCALSKDKKPAQNEAVEKNEIEENNQTVEENMEENESTTKEAESAVKIPVTLEKATFEVPEYFLELTSDQDYGLPYVRYIIDVGASFNLVVEDLSKYPGITLEQYIEIALASAKYDYKTNIYKEINGYRVNELITSPGDNGTILHQTTFLHDNKAYIFTYGSLEENYDEYLPVIEEILQTVSFN
ncbi:hypothetical protein [Fervidibacillus halotolerans]|uniref:Lipoprotein n=1 Tax=Fervidibacillus halotolerans TaxID=2980027 RepID=A0A9E8RYB2_9BACI|nr:hypothetical protein [Fervidibacillus halotolerans]WAA12661.1 hypothetical protein OE105_00510 [Fervidibacillus halotolerans]